MKQLQTKEIKTVQDAVGPEDDMGHSPVKDGLHPVQMMDSPMGGIAHGGICWDVVPHLPADPLERLEDSHHISAWTNAL